MVHRQQLLGVYGREDDCTRQLRFKSREAGNSPVVQSHCSREAKTWLWTGKKAVCVMRLEAGLGRRGTSSRGGVAEEVIIRIMLSGETGSYKSVGSALLLPISLKCNFPSGNNL